MSNSNEPKVEGNVEETNGTEEVQQQEENQSTDNVETDELSQKEEQVKQLESKVEEINNRLLRSQADFDNFRRRVRLDSEAAQKYRSQSLIEDLLPVLDNFTRALTVEAKDENSQSIIKGMDMVYRQFIDALQKEGLEVIEAQGKEFDPNFHQAVMQVEDENYESNIVVEELQKGYKLKDRVLRPTMVKVNQ